MDKKQKLKEIVKLSARKKPADMYPIINELLLDKVGALIQDKKREILGK